MPATVDPDTVLLLLHSGDAASARSLGFNAVGLAPFGPADAPVDTLGNKEGCERIRQASAEIDVIVDLPFIRHAANGALPLDHPEWFASAPGDQGAIDPRKPAHRALRTQLFDNPAHHEAQQDWLIDVIGKVAKAGASGLRLPGLSEIPPDFVIGLIARIRTAHPDLTLVGDALGGSFEHIKALDDAGFDYLMDSGAWWDGHASWYTDQRRELQTPTLGFPQAPEGDELTARSSFSDPLTAAAWQTGVAVLGARGVLVPKSLLTQLGAEYEGFLEDILSVRARHEWLKEKGPLRAAGTAPALVRFDTDPRTAHTAIGIVPTGMSGPARRASGSLPAWETVASVAGLSVIVATDADRQDSATRPPKQSESHLRDLADRRIAIEGVYPSVDGGRFAAKRVVGDWLEVGADIFCDGHEELAARLTLTERGGNPISVPLKKQVNDRWTGRVQLTRLGRAGVTIEAWRDLFGSWQTEIRKKRGAGQDVSLELLEGRAIAQRSLDAMDPDAMPEEDARLARALSAEVAAAGDDPDKLSTALENDIASRLIRTYGERANLTRFDHAIPIIVDREAARFSSWYELFPRSQSGKKDVHGTFDDVIGRMPYVRDLGFDVLYFPPIHPIGRTNMKGKNNTLTPDPDDVGSPYAIGSEAGGHDAIHPQLGTIEDFDRMVAAAADHGLEIALDFAIQCSPDHPWLKEHPEWFDWRPDGSIKFAENPPKKYEDIVNVHFYRDAIPELWYALRDVLLYWCEHRVRIFRVDNPHTKPYPFWEWVIGEVKDRYPDTLFLSEAFTRPKVMKRLAKLGFTQSYTYYTWRNTKHELEAYVRELTQGESREVMNPNFFVNTPDINPEVLQTNNRAAYIARTILAGTLASSYGIYNGVEIAEGTPLPGKEEYLDSEKYEIRVWDFDRPGHIKDDIRRLNGWRRRHPALQDHLSVRFLTAWNEQILWYAKRTPDRRDYLVFGVTLDFEREQRATVELPLWEFGLGDDATIEAIDLYTEEPLSFTGKYQEITLSPDRPYVAFRLVPPHGFERQGGALFADPEVSE